tara:strand:- start:31 stop:504 length:474 start_codon:yes stop_codon:yes gene_type:complete
MKIIINESQFNKLILKEDSNEQLAHAKKIVNNNLLRRLEDQINHIRSYDELFYEMKRTVMKFISMIKDEFSVSSNELSIDVKELLKYIKRTIDNNRLINKGIGRNKVGQLLNIITQELNRFKSIVSQSNDSDNDGIPNRLDIDDDNDGVLDPNDTDS